MQRKPNKKKPEAQAPSLNDLITKRHAEFDKRIIKMEALRALRSRLWADFEAGKITIGQLTDQYLKASNEAFAEPEPQQSLSPKPHRVPKPIRLLCINPGPIERIRKDGTYLTHTGLGADLEYTEVYTTPGAAVDENGNIVYPLNEFDGVEMLAERFVVLKGGPGKKKRSAAE